VATEGIDETLALYDAAWQAAQEGLADAVHDAIIEEMKRRIAKVPVLTGALRKALTNKNDRAHNAEVVITRKGWALDVGVSGKWGPTNPSRDKRPDGTLKNESRRGGRRDKPHKAPKTTNTLRALIFRRNQKQVPRPVTRRVVEAAHAEYEATILRLAGEGGGGLTGDLTLGKIGQRRKKRRSRRRRSPK
jgi:hypothetical protein